MIDVKRKSIRKEAGGLISFHFVYVETETNEEIKSDVVQATTAAAVKAALRAKITKEIAVYAAQKSLEATADQQFNELRTELGLPAGG